MIPDSLVNHATIESDLKWPIIAYGLLLVPPNDVGCIRYRWTNWAHSMGWRDTPTPTIIYFRGPYPYYFKGKGKGKGKGPGGGAVPRHFPPLDPLQFPLNRLF